MQTFLLNSNCFDSLKYGYKFLTSLIIPNTSVTTRKPLYRGKHQELKIVCYRIASATWGFFPNWFILLQKPAVRSLGIVQSTPKCVKRPLLGEERAKRHCITGYHTYLIIRKPLVGKYLQCMNEPTNKVDKNVVAVVRTNSYC